VGTSNEDESSSEMRNGSNYAMNASRSTELMDSAGEPGSVDYPA